MHWTYVWFWHSTQFLNIWSSWAENRNVCRERCPLLRSRRHTIFETWPIAVNKLPSSKWIGLLWIFREQCKRTRVTQCMSGVNPKLEWFLIFFFNVASIAWRATCKPRLHFERVTNLHQGDLNPFAIFFANCDWIQLSRLGKDYSCLNTDMVQVWITAFIRSGCK